MITKTDLKKAGRLLLQSSELKELGEDLIKIADTTESAESYGVNLIDRNHYCATILWQTEDFVNAIENRGLEATDNILNYVISESRKGLEDCSDGWETIEYCIDDYLRNIEEN